MSSPSLGTALRVVLPLLVLLAAFPSHAAQEPAEEAVETAGESKGGVDRERDRVTVLDGATIRWNTAERRLEAPSAEEAARLAAAFRRLLEDKASAPGFRRLASPGEPDEAVLPGGLVRVRLGVEHLNFSLVRRDDGGRLVESCAGGVDDAARRLATPADGPVEER